MARKMIVNRLEKDELEWELRLRGVKTGSCEEMRTSLTMALRLEKSGDSLRYPKYPFSFDEDVAALEKKFTDIEALLDIYSGGANVNETQKLQTKLAHAMNRLDQVETDADSDKEAKKSVLASKLLGLYDIFHSKVNATSTYVPAALSVVTAGQFQAGVQNVPMSSPVGTTARINTSTGCFSKMVPPHKWGIEKFSGTSRSLSVTAFFEKVEELRIARNVPKDVLLDSGVDLFGDKAYQFYKDARLRVTSWEELCDEFKREYLSAHHTDLLFDELRKRTQHPSESIGVYLAVMSSYFSRLGCQISEEAKMSIITKNLHPFYQDRLRDPLPQTIEDLRQVCRRMEDRRDAINSYVEPCFRKGNILEKDLAFVEVEPVQPQSRHEIATTSVQDSKKEIVCFRCKKPGHRAVGCVLPKKFHCFKCGKDGYTSKTCPKCNSNPGNQSERS